MKYIRTHEDFAKHVNKEFNLNIPDKELSKINEAFENDVTLSNSLIGQLFGWIFRKVGSSIEKGKMSSLLKELSREFGKGQYSSVKNKKIAKKNLLYSTIVGLKKMTKDKEMTDDEFGKKFPKVLDKAIEDVRDLIEGKGDVRIDDDNPEMIKVAKDFYDKLSELKGNKVELKKTIDDDEIDDKNLDDEGDEENYDYSSTDESMGLNIPEGLFNQLEIAGDSKIDVIVNNLEQQLKTDILYENNLIKIDGVSSVNFKEIDDYFKALNISVEMVNDVILIENFDRFGLINEYNLNKNEPFVLRLSDWIRHILTRRVKLDKGYSTISAIGMKTDKDFEEKANNIMNSLAPIYSKNFLGEYLNDSIEFGNEKITNLLKSLQSSMSDLSDSVNDSSGFRDSFKKFKSNLIALKDITSNILDKSPDEFFKDGDNNNKTNTKLKKDENGKILVNAKTWSKIDTLKYKKAKKAKTVEIIEVKPNPNPPKDLKYDMVSVMPLKGGAPYPINGDNVVEVKTDEVIEKTPNGILNTDQKRKRAEEEGNKSDVSKWLDSDLTTYLYNKEIEYKKDDGSKGTATILDKKIQQKRIADVGSLAIKFTSGGEIVISNIEQKLISVDGKEYNKKEKAANKEYARTAMSSLFPDDELYERELIINDRDKKDLLNTIKHKAKNSETLINPLRVLKIFNSAHDKYTIEDFESVPDGSQGSVSQGKGRGYNKKKNYKKMPDDSGRNIKLFKQWNDGVIDLLEKYGEYIPEKLKKFIVKVLNDNTIFGNGGAQAKLLSEYFNIKVDIEDLGIGEKKPGSKESGKREIYIETKDSTGEFKEPESGSLQMKKENFKNAAFILKGNIEGVKQAELVCYYIGTSNGLILFKYKKNNMDFLNNYKRSGQDIKNRDFNGSPEDEVRYGAMKIPKGANRDLKENDKTIMWTTDVELEEPIKNGNFGIDKVYYLQGINDGGVMRLDSARKGSDYGDFQPENFKVVEQKFNEIKA